MKEMSPEALARHRRFLEAHRRCVASEAELVASLVEVFEGKVFLELGYSSVYDYALLEVGFESDKTEALLRMGLALRGLPLLSAAFSQGLIERTKVREIVRVASASTEREWVAIGTSKSYRDIEALCRRTSKGMPPGVLSEGDTERPRRRRVSLLLLDDTASALEEVIEALRGEGDERVDCDAAVLELVGLVARGRRAVEEEKKEALEGKKEKTRSRVLDPRQRPLLLLIACPSCKKTVLQTRSGEVEVSAEAEASISKSAVIVDGEAVIREAEAVYAGRKVTRVTPIRFRKRREHVPRVSRLAVFARARFRCEVPGCTERKFLELAHIENWFTQDDSLENHCCLCRAHNVAHEEGHIQLVGPYSKLRVIAPLGRALAT